MSALLNLANFGRGAFAFGDLSGIVVTVQGNGATYAAASGGLPIDLTGILQQAAPAGWDAPYGIQALNPADIVGLIPLGASTAGYMPGNLVVGTPTYTAVPWQSGYIPPPVANVPSGNESATPGYLATCPATIRLWNGTAQSADTTNSDVVTFILLVARSGANN